MCRKTSWILSATLVALVVPSLASAAVLYSDNFNLPTDSANWTVNVAPTANAATQDATFGFDYSAFGIPAAPGSSDTLGLRLRANIPGSAAAPVTTRPGGVTSGLSVSPTGQNFGSNYVMTFYAWSNFNGAPNASGLADNGNSEGGTNNVMFAAGTSGTVPLVVGNTGLVTNGQMDGIGFATTGDGGITNDYRIYPKSGTFTPAGQLRGWLNCQYGGLLYKPVSRCVRAGYPADTVHSRVRLRRQQYTGWSDPSCAFGFAWHKVQVVMNGNVAYWIIDNAPIANLNVSAITLGGNNIALGQSDVNSSTTRHPSLLFTVFDNLSVESVPEPSTVCLSLLGLVGLIGSRRRG